MNVPSLTLRSVKNETGIDISVPCLKLEEAPLGGTSILYEISVLTNLEEYKTTLHKETDAVQFSIFKAYREIEDFYNKLSKKYPTAGLPPVTKLKAVNDAEKRLILIDGFMNLVATNSDICSSLVFKQFIGIHSQNVPSCKVSSKDIYVKEKEDEISKPKEEKEPDIFPKMKPTNVDKSPQPSQVAPKTEKAEFTDLFEEVKSVRAKNESVEKQRPLSKGLFDDIEDDDLFMKPENNKPTSAEVKTEEFEKDVSQPEDTKRSSISSQNGDHAQDLAGRQNTASSTYYEDDYMAKSEKFSCINPKLIIERMVKEVQSDPDAVAEILSVMNPSLPTFSNEKSVNVEVTHSMSTENEEKQSKPVPKPRNKISPAPDKITDPKPPVMPKTSVSARPPVPAKPALVVKPAVAPKPKVAPRKPSSGSISVIGDKPSVKAPDVHDLAGDLNKLDISKYIEQEIKMLDSEPNLFD